MTNAAQENMNDPWTIEDARAVYNIDRWGAEYFGINAGGRVVAHPQQAAGAEVELMEVLATARDRGFKAPLLVRFQDILRHRVEAICAAFDQSIEEHDFTGRYRGVFPVKVNSLREVVEEILDAGRPHGFGLEVGSKPELHAALALQDEPGSLLICNGYKDDAFIRTALMGTRLGRQVVLVVEKPDELRRIISVAKREGVRPQLGIRMRLLSRSTGKWADSGGEDAKFGLNTAELMAAIELLRAEGWEDCFRLLHFHIGSQVPDILTVRKAVQEGARFYAKVRQLGFPLEYLDVGGGLAVDYDGSRAAFESSANYSLQEYTNDVVQTVAEVCNAEDVPHPNLISESGRAVVAHHSVLLVEVFGANNKTPKTHKPRLKYGKEEHPLVEQLLRIRRGFARGGKLAAYHDAVNCKDDATNMFTLGVLGLEEKAKVETLYWEICQKVVAYFRNAEHVPEEITQLEDQLSDQYVCNFSLFQSLLDHWAVEQLFPIVPLSRHTERPTREATLVDITCDSDGAVRKFINLEDVRDTLPLHPLRKNSKGNEPYFLGFFLMGAYQDVMGNLHNLFGRVNEIHVFLDPDEPSGYYIEEIIRGQTLSGSLDSVQFHRRDLQRQMKKQFDAAIRDNRLKPSEGMRLLEEYERGLDEYTYLSF
ncbi:MAG: biosynthetic arginine decarboxylase [Verrucomicrobia subdivision 3 bacterium]|nr:biosynthetic arginine decarboxylase [Limisphaerales bacterium]